MARDFCQFGRLANIVPKNIFFFLYFLLDKWPISMVDLEQKERESEMIGFFDFDMTTAVTIGKETPSLSQFKDSRFAVRDILNAKPTNLTRRMKRYRQVYILTARSSGNGKMRNAMKKYFLRNGIYIPNSHIIMLGDWTTNLSTAEKKATILESFSRKLGKVDFYDDDIHNIERSRFVEKVYSFFA